MAQRHFLFRNEVAQILGVSPATVSRWARKGYLPCVETAGGHRRYSPEDVEELRERLLGRDKSTPFEPESLETLLRRAGLRTSEEASIVEVRCHGRAGQGLITMGELLAEAALKDGRFFQAYPEFGPERSGAPMESFIRISPLPIDTHAPIRNPQIVMVLDPTLLGQVPVFEGMSRDGLAVVNSHEDPDSLRSAVPSLGDRAVATVDASAIAMETLARPIPNVPLLGALLRASSMVTPDAMAGVIVGRLGARLAPAVVDANVAAFWEGHRRAVFSPAIQRRQEVLA